jgi:hypothetical protein
MSGAVRRDGDVKGRGGTDLNGLNVPAGVIEAAGECEGGAIGVECALVVCGTHGG